MVRVTIPAETARQLVAGAQDEIAQQRDRGNYNNASSIQNAAAEALEKAAGKDGEFVSIQGHHLSTLTAFSEERSACTVSIQFLEQFNVW